MAHEHESVNELPQLEMVWPWGRKPAPEPVLLPDGVAMRTWADGDEEGWLDLIDLAGWGRWTHDQFRDYFHRTLPDGFFLVVDERSGRIVAAAQALHGANDRHPFGGQVGWVATHPDWRGRGLGRAVTVAVTRRLLEAGYRHLYLGTEDFRAPALRIYLTLGYEPFLWSPDMPDRWREICARVGVPFTPDEWPRG